MRDEEAPLAFLPPPRRPGKSFTDELLFEPPAEGSPRRERLTELADEAIADNPRCDIVAAPWHGDTEQYSRLRRHLRERHARGGVAVTVLRLHELRELHASLHEPEDGS